MKSLALSHLDFNLLLDLDALLSEGSVVGAARCLHISPPAMSRRLTRLREAVGDPLFVPAGRGLVPTQRAVALQQKVRTAIQGVRGVFTPNEIDFLRLQRNFSLRANDGFLGAWASGLVSRLIAQAPGVSLQFVPRADKAIDSLRNGLVDLDIGVPGPAEPEIYSQPLFSAAFVGVVREGHPLALKRNNKAVSAKDFAAWPHISASRRAQDAGRIDKALKELGLKRRVVAVAPGFQAALAMTAASDFITAIPETFVRWAMAHHRLHILKLPIALPPVVVSQSWHVRHHADPAHRWLREQVVSACASAHPAFVSQSA